jgi:predicted acyl esterase
VQKITPGTVVESKTGLWATGMDFEEGESLSVRISGDYPLVDESKGRRLKKPQLEDRMKDSHHVHLDGEYASHVILS